MEIAGYSGTYDKLVSGDNDISGMIAYCMYRADKNKFINSIHKQNPSTDESKNVAKLISDFSKNIKNDEIEQYKIDAETVLASAIQERVDEITNAIFNSIDTEYKKQSRIVLINYFVLIFTFVSFSLSLCYFYYQDSLYEKGLGFENSNEVLFYIFERYSPKIFIIVGLITVMRYFVKLFMHAYSNNQDIHNALANRIYLQLSTLDDESLEKFKEFVLLKIQNEPLKSTKVNKSFISFKKLQKIKSLLSLDEKK